MTSKTATPVFSSVRADDVMVEITECSVIDFDGQNDYITFKNNYNFNNEFSIEAWVKPNSVSGNTTVYSRKDANDNTSGYNLCIVNGQVQFNWYYGSGSGSVTTGATSSAGSSTSGPRRRPEYARAHRSPSPLWRAC